MDDESILDARITKVDEAGVYLVESRNGSGAAHRVNASRGTCPCEAGRFGIECWHLDYARIFYYWGRYRARPQLLPERTAQLTARKTAATAA